MNILSPTAAQPEQGNRYLPLSLLLVFALLLSGYFTYQWSRQAQQHLRQNIENSAGRNGQHANQAVRQKAEEMYQKAKEAFDKLNQKPKKTKADNKLLEKLKKQVEHWRKKKDWKGENHSQTHKGN